MQNIINMMSDSGIVCVVGLPGGGKSLSLVELIGHIDGWVFGNIDLTDDHPSVRRGNYVRIGVSHGYHLWDWEKGRDGIDRLPRGTARHPVWIIIDEAHIKFHQFLFSRAPFDLQRRFVEYISTHRKRHHNLVFSTQKISKIWKEIRNVSQGFLVCFDEAKVPRFLNRIVPSSVLPFKRVLFPDELLIPSEALSVSALTKISARSLYPLYNTRQVDHD